MFKPSVEEIIRVMNNHGYRVYDTPSVDWNLNIVGIRANTPIPERFDDTLVLFHRFMGEWEAYYYKITTDPSLHYLRNPINSKGTAVLVPGQYRGAYALDIHGRGRAGAHKALCQRKGSVKVYRDKNRDTVLDLDPSTIQEGMFGINVHRGPRGGQDDPSNSRYSAGCQVFADDRMFADFLMKCEYGAEAFGNTFTYTLLLCSDFS